MWAFQSKNKAEAATPYTISSKWRDWSKGFITVHHASAPTEWGGVPASHMLTVARQYKRLIPPPQLGGEDLRDSDPAAFWKCMSLCSPRNQLSPC